MAENINNPGGVDVPGEVWPEGDLPAQGGRGPTLMPGQSTFTLPLTLAQLFSEKEMKDTRQTLPNGQSNPTYGQLVKRTMLKFDKSNPLVVADGPHMGETLMGTVSSQPRPRGKMDDPKTPWISDLAFMLEIGLNDKSRPTTAEALKQRISLYAGKTIRLEHGLSARCDPERVKYVIVEVRDAAGNVTETTVQDPQGRKGCADDTKQRADKKGKQGRYYTSDFKDPQTGTYMDSIQCDTVIGVVPQTGQPIYCDAVLRGFPQIERFLPPIGVAK